MGKELQEYPTFIEPGLDFEATKQFIGEGSCVYSIKHLRDGFRKTIVYMLQQKEGDEIVYDKGKYIGRKCIHGIIVAGYLRGIFRNKIKVIPEAEKERVESKLKQKIKTSSYIDFWD